MGLKDHLESYKKLTHHFHDYHRSVVQCKELTSKIILEKKMTRCPSYICDKAYKLSTPEELCHHLAILGVYPFWKPGMKLDKDEASNSSSDVIFKTHDLNNLMIKETKCSICLDKCSDVIFYPCKHNVVCLECGCKINKCPYCRSNIETKIPY